MAKLIGTDPNQVPTNADLGTMAYTQVDNLPQISAKWVDVYDPTNRQSNLEIHTTDYYRDSGDPDLAYNWRFTNEGNVNRLRLMGVNPNMSPANIFPLYVEGDTQDIVLTGNVRVSNGKGMDFGASSGSNSTSTILDDYEEGTFTPTLEGSTSNPTVTYVTANTGGKYVKIGRIVYVTYEVRTSAISGGGGAVRIGGMPYARASTNQPDGDRFSVDLYNVTFPSGTTYVVNNCPQNQDYFGLLAIRDGTTHTEVLLSGWPTSGTVIARAAGFYYTDS